MQGRRLCSTQTPIATCSRHFTNISITFYPHFLSPILSLVRSEENRWAYDLYSREGGTRDPQFGRKRPSAGTLSADPRNSNGYFGNTRPEALIPVVRDVPGPVSLRATNSTGRARRSKRWRLQVSARARTTIRAHTTARTMGGRL